MTPTEMTAVELLAAYAAKELSPVEATTAVLDRIDEVDGQVNAMCLVDREGALAQARASEARWQAGAPQGLLDGVPTSMKDIFLTRGWPTLRGSRSIDPDQAWDVDAPVTARLRADGMVLVGKNTTPEIAWKGVTDSPLTGVTRNPIDPRMTAGGSSGGASAVVAAGMAPVAVGTDAGGSIRIPASFCGIVGFKPTHGRVPMFPASPFGPLAHAGPMTRTVDDAALLLDVISQPDPRDPTALDVPSTPFREQATRDVSGLHVAYSGTLGWIDVDDEVARVCDAAVAAIDAAGMPVTATDPGFADPFDAFELLWGASAATLLRTMPGARETIDPGLGRAWDLGESVSGIDVFEARAVAAQLGITMGAFHEQHPLLITPTMPIPAFESGHDVPPGSGMTHWARWTPFTYPFNMTQQPAISIPVGTTSAGLPVGLQIIGPRHADGLVLAAARWVEGVLAG